MNRNKKYIISNPIRRNYKKNKKKDYNNNYLILLHRVGLDGKNIERANELLEIYKKNIDEVLGDIPFLTIKNIIVGISDNNDVTITSIYPNVEDILEKLKGNLTISQERKIKIFQLLDTKK